MPFHRGVRTRAVKLGRLDGEPMAVRIIIELEFNLK